MSQPPGLDCASPPRERPRRGASVAAFLSGLTAACRPHPALDVGPPPPRGQAPLRAEAATPQAPRASPPPAAPATFENPVLAGTAPDPSACRVGEDYYLVTSSFEYFPGIPIFHSRDLAHWQQLGHVLTRESQLPLRAMPSSQGIFAPTIRHHHGTYYVVTTNMQGGGSFLVTATDPKGPWSDPVFVKEEGFTMDPSLFFDDDGKVYYTRHGGQRHGAIYQAEIDVTTGALDGVPRLIWKGTGDIWPEGPHLYKVDGTYYLMISEGGTSYEHMVTLARAKSPWGPFEPAPNNPILTHRALADHPIQATGHADLIATPNGQWWMVLLGIRPSSPRRHHIGRETFLAPVAWGHGWPIVNGGRPIELELPTTGLPAWQPWPSASPKDEFASEALAVNWQFVRNPTTASYSLTARPGWLRLFSTRVTMSEVASPTLVVQRQRHHRVRIATEAEFAPRPGQRAGLAVRGNEENHYHLLIEGAAGGQRDAVAVATIAGARQELGRQRLAPGPAILVIEGYPDRYAFFLEQGSAAGALGEAPTAPFAYEQTQSFTGAFVGLYAHHDAGAAPAAADFAWFEYRPR